jgi:hypothetical protein
VLTIEIRARHVRDEKLGFSAGAGVCKDAG